MANSIKTALRAALAAGFMAFAAGPAQACPGFEGPDGVELRMLSGGVGLLTAPLTYCSKSGERYTVPRGYRTNGASIPRALWSVVGSPWTGDYVKAAILHDYMCERQIKTSDYAHKTFREAMVASGVSAVRAAVMYGAVDFFGPKWPGFGPGADTAQPMSKAEIEEVLRSVCRGSTAGECGAMKRRLDAM